MTSQTSLPYHGEDFCLIHGREHMRSTMGNPIPWCQACEDERLNPPADLSTFNLRRELIAAQRATSDPVRRDQLQILIEQCDRRDPGAVKAMARQAGVIDGTTRTMPFDRS